MILMPLTCEITVEIGSGFVSRVFLKVGEGQAGGDPPQMWVVSISFVIFPAKDWIAAVLVWIP